MSETSAVVEKSLRSVFVGNIPYEATEEKLRDIFSQVGPVLSFKLMYDRESGKPKGYGFCEYKDQETALSAMRNLNGFEIGGRPLRVDNACTEKSRMEMQSLMMGPVIESPFGPDVEPEKAPEAISNAVASLPPEQMYELMRQMKLCVRNNPSEARTMLMNNPQLAYALLQAQVVMRIIDPKIAVQILYGSRDPVEPILPTSTLPSGTLPNNTSALPSGAPAINGAAAVPQGAPPIPSNMPTHYPPPQNTIPPPVGPTSAAPSLGPRTGVPPAPSHPPAAAAAAAAPPPPPPPSVPFSVPQQQPSRPPHPVPPPATRIAFPSGDYDLRQMGSTARGPVTQVPPSSDQDMRMPPTMGTLPASIPHDSFPSNHENGRFGRDYDQRDRFREGNVQSQRGDREQREPYGRDRGAVRDPRERERDRDRDKDYRNNPPMEGGRDPRGRNFPSQDKDFRSITPNQGTTSAVQGPRPPQLPSSNSGPPSGANLPPGLAGQDQEKASLIMQVLQLSDEQIRMLPPEQQASILQLKDQIQRSSH